MDSTTKWNIESHRGLLKSSERRPSLAHLLFNQTSTNRKSTLKEILSDKIYSEEISHSSDPSSEQQNFTQMNLLFRAIFLKIGSTGEVLLRGLFSIFGVVLFTRLAPVFGNVGIVFGPILVLLCEAIVFLTVLSVCAIITNGEIHYGGVYFLVSRSLGPRFGFTIGMQFFLANCFSISLYLLGLAEALDAIFQPNFRFFEQVLSIFLLLLVFALSVAQNRVLFVLQIFLVVPLIVVSLICVFVGMAYWQSRGGNPLIAGFSAATIRANVKIPTFAEFFLATGIFFPGTLGVMSGANTAESLEKPEKSMPRGMMSGVAISTFTYLLLGIVMSSSVLGKNLVGVDLILSKIAINKWVVNVSLIASILSQAITNFNIAPNLLGGIVNDNFLRPLKVFKGRHMRLKLQLTVFVISALFILPGSFDIIAPVITAFTVITYTVLNFACFLHSFQKTPNWRPNFRFYNAYVSLTAAIIGIALIFVLDYVAALMALGITVIFAGIAALIKPEVDWGGAIDLVTMSSAIRSLKNLENKKIGAKSFRLHFLVLSDEKSMFLPKFAKNVLKEGKVTNFFGTIFCHKNYDGNYNTFFKLKKRRKIWLDQIRNFKGFPKSVFATDFHTGANSLIQSTGVSIITPNSVLMGYRENWGCNSDISTEINNSDFREKMAENEEKSKLFVETIRSAMLFEKDVVILRRFSDFDFESVYRNETLDVWWTDDDGGFGILFPYIVSLYKKFENFQIRVMEIVHKNSRTKSTFTMGSLLWKLRIPAKVVPVEVTMNSKAISEESLFLYSKCVGKKLNQIVLDFETVSILCLGDKISELSKEAFMTFVTLPVAKMGLPWREYLGILEVLSFRSKRLCFVRGNQENVLTSEL